MRLPEGSWTRIWRPPGPLTTSLRKRTPAERRRAISASRSEVTKWIRFQPPGLGGAVGHGAAGGAGRSAQQEPQVACDDICEGRYGGGWASNPKWVV